MSFFSGSSAFWQQAWPLVGWTMLWFLASGTIVLFVATVLRMALKRANSQVRYFTSLAGFAVLALLPIFIAAYLATTLPRERGKVTSIAELTPNIESTNQIDLKNHPIVSREAKRVGDERAAITETAIPSWDNRAMLNSLLNAIVSYLPWLWLVGTPLTFLLLATGLIGAERLRKSCQALTDGPILAACERVRTQLAIARHVRIAICHSVSSPLLIGVVKPLILLPPAALTGWTTNELEMVLLHELAHVRRWDNAVNLVQRLVESLLFFHPATWIMSNWVRRDREDCCDAIVVRQTAKPQAYAELLLSLASHTPGLATSVAMAQHPIASRIRRILKIEDEPMLISRKGLTLGVGIVLATVLLAFALPASEAEEQVSREAERVDDERSAEETTNLTNGTNKDLNAEDPVIIGVTHEKVFQLIPVIAEDDAMWKATQETLMKSQNVLSRVVNDPKISPLPVMQQAKPNALMWLSNNLSITFTSDNKVLLSLVGPTRDKEELKTVAQAVIKSYLEERKTLQEKQDSLFPTLEEQRAADLAYKLLGVELEKATPEDLERVKRKGFNGGLLVRSEDNPVHGLRTYDLLVGLHVWPTESLQQVTEILHRDDLEQLTPLKFYVVRQGSEGPGRGPVIGIPAGTDTLITGRINVDLDAWAEKEGFKQQRLKQSQPTTSTYPAPESSATTLESNFPGYPSGQAVAQSSATNGEFNQQLIQQLNREIAQLELHRDQLSGHDKERMDTSIAQVKDIIEKLRNGNQSPQQNKAAMQGEWFQKPTDAILLYDGKTFDDWRDLWTTELKTEKRVECIKALAAFGRAGRGKEASEAILDVAAEFDFGNFEGSSAQDLKQAITKVLAGIEGIEGQYWLPQLIERLKADPAKWNSFAEWVLQDARGKDVVPYLKQLARDPRLSVYARAGAIAGLATQQDIADDAESITMVREVLTGDDPKMIPALISNLNFSRLELFPEQAEFLIHKNDVIRNAAWGQFRRGFNPAQGVPFMELFLKVIDDPTRKEDHTRAIEALGLLSSHFSQNADMQKRQPEVVDKLTQLLIDGDVELMPATLLARSKLGAQSVELLIRNLGDKLSEDRRQQLEDAAEKAEELEAQQNPMGMGGGMGGGGGGMF